MPYKGAPEALPPGKVLKPLWCPIKEFLVTLNGRNRPRYYWWRIKPAHGFPIDASVLQPLDLY
jgi:hypothetical protein